MSQSTMSSSSSCASVIPVVPSVATTMYLVSAMLEHALNRKRRIATIVDDQHATAFRRVLRGATMSRRRRRVFGQRQYNAESCAVPGAITRPRSFRRARSIESTFGERQSEPQPTPAAIAIVCTLREGVKYPFQRALVHANALDLLTVNRGSFHCEGGAVAIFTVTSPPRGENFIALCSRLPTTCDSRVTSPRTQTGSFGASSLMLTPSPYAMLQVSAIDTGLGQLD